MSCFDTAPGFRLNLQTVYNLRVSEIGAAKKIMKEVLPRAA